MKKVIGIIIVGLLLTGCGRFTSEPVSTLEPMRIIDSNMEAIDYMTKVIERHASEYSAEDIRKLIQTQGSLLSILEYMQRLSSTGEANLCNVTTIWQQAQAEYYKLLRTIDTETWTEPEKVVYILLRKEAQRLSAEVDYSISIASENASRKTMDSIMSQIMMVSSVMLPLL